MESSDSSATSEESMVLSYESSSFGSSSEVSDEGIVPFMHEPLASTSSGGESDESSEEDVSPRLLNLNWYIE